MSSTATLKRRPESPGIASRFSPFPSMAEQVQSGPQQSRARRFLGAGKRTLDGEDRSERIKTGRKGTLFRAFSPTIKPEFPFNLGSRVLSLCQRRLPGDWEEAFGHGVVLLETFVDPQRH